MAAQTSSNVPVSRVKLMRAGEAPAESEGDAQRSVVYWVNNSVRVEDNYALLYAQELAIQKKQPLVVVYHLLKAFPTPKSRRCEFRQYHFLLKGLEAMKENLAKLDIPFCLYLEGKFNGMPHVVSQSLHDLNASDCVVDNDKCRTSIGWKEETLRRTRKSCAFHEVECGAAVWGWEAPEKNISTFSGKLQKRMGEFLAPFATVQKHPHQLSETHTAKCSKQLEKFTADDLLTNWYKGVDMTVQPCSFLQPSTEAGARKALTDFLENGLQGYAQSRGTLYILDQLNAYLRFGQLGLQTILQAVVPLREKFPRDADAFLHDTVISHEFAMVQHYFSAGGTLESKNCTVGAGKAVPIGNNGIYRSFDVSSWAFVGKIQAPGKGIYTREQLMVYKTHDQVWNMIQKTLIEEGRMVPAVWSYWAQKILEWSATPESAFETALFFKDRHLVGSRNAYRYQEVSRSMGGHCEIRDWRSEMSAMQASYEKRIAELESTVQEQSG